jgi:hypothetical protein
MAIHSRQPIFPADFTPFLEQNSRFQGLDYDKGLADLETVEIPESRIDQ